MLTVKFASNSCNIQASLLIPLIVLAILQISHAQYSPADYVNAHNAARAQVYVTPISWDDGVASFARNHLNKIRGSCELRHSAADGPFGENLAWSTGNLTATDAVNLWVEEKQDYNYNSNTCVTRGVCLHYTQVVWNNSVRLGCARVVCADSSGTLISCNYDPPGNAIGQRPYELTRKGSWPKKTRKGIWLQHVAPAQPPTQPPMVAIPLFPGEEENSWNLPLIVGGAAGTLLICITIFCCAMKSLRQKIRHWMTTKADQEIEAFIRGHGPLAPTRYKFAEVKKMTKSFKVKLGQGGYGTVYKGRLLNGCPVAVKILKPSKGNGEEFINEVASISRTSHVNVVTLLGFCLEGQKKALVYEFMPNGSLNKFICNKADRTTPSLSWEKLYQIAIGIARGLEYLHKGCNTRILHFDIKPHNILLDESFCPKIADFGLAKLCLRKESIISISEARGTIGYLAPEVWNRNVGGVSHKSDVYSYGMMLLDMVGGRKNINNEASCTTEVYFPDWIYDELEQGNDLVRDVAITTEEHDIAKRMTIVGLWCIQTFPTHRPTIGRVIDMLEGSLDSLEMPPKPITSSPTRLQPESSTTSTTY